MFQIHDYHCITLLCTCALEHVLSECGIYRSYVLLHVNGKCIIIGCVYQKPSVSQRVAAVALSPPRQTNGSLSVSPVITEIWLCHYRNTTPSSIIPQPLNARVLLCVGVHVPAPVCTYTFNYTSSEIKGYFWECFKPFVKVCSASISSISSVTSQVFS